MGALTQDTDYFVKRLGGDESTTLVITTLATVDDADTLTVTLANYGISTFLGANGYIHTTSDSVIVAEAPTTSVTSGVLTLTVGGSTDNKKRTYIVYGE